MKIDKRLNLVIPIFDESPKPKIVCYVHSTPISEETFDAFWEPIGITFNRIYSGGLGVPAGARLADKMLRKVSLELGVWEGASGVQNGLINEIHRLTNVLITGPAGWQMVPYHDAVQKQVIDKRDAAGIEAALVFFTVASTMHRRNDLTGILELAGSLWGLQIESRNCTELMSYLRTSTAAENSGATAAA